MSQKEPMSQTEPSPMRHPMRQKKNGGYDVTEKKELIRKDCKKRLQ